MPLTPDRHPGPLIENEELRLIEIVGDPAEEGRMRYVGGNFRLKDQLGVFNPRDGSGAPTDAPYLTNGAVSGLSAEEDITNPVTSLIWQAALELKSISATALGYTLGFYQDSASPAADDVVGRIDFFGNDLGPAKKRFGRIESFIGVATDGASKGGVKLVSFSNDVASSILQVYPGQVTTDANTLLFNTATACYIDTVATSLTLRISSGSTSTLKFTTDQLLLTSIATGASGAELQLYQNSASPADEDVVGFASFYGMNDAGGTPEKILFAKLTGIATDITDGTEDGAFEFHVIGGGTDRTAVRLTSASGGTEFKNTKAAGAGSFAYWLGCSANWGRTGYPIFIEDNCAGAPGTGTTLCVFGGDGSLQFSSAAHTSTDPMVTQTTDLDTGLAFTGANEVALYAGGNATLTATLTQILANGTVGGGGNLGSPTTPVYARAGDTDTGLYWAATNQFAIAAGGVGIAIFDALFAQIKSVAASTTGPELRLLFAKTGSAAADNDISGYITFQGFNDHVSGTEIATYAAIYGVAIDVSDGSEDGQLDFHLMAGGTDKTALSLISTGGECRFQNTAAGGTGDGAFVFHAKAAYSSTNRILSIQDGTPTGTTLVFVDGDGAVHSPTFTSGAMATDLYVRADGVTTGTIHMASALRVNLDALGAVAGDDSIGLRFTGTTSAAARNIDVYNEADSGTDTYRLLVKNDAGTIIAAFTSAGALRPAAGIAGTLGDSTGIWQWTYTAGVSASPGGTSLTLRSAATTWIKNDLGYGVSLEKVVSAGAGDDSRVLQFTGQTSAADRSIGLFNEADAGTDTYRLRINNSAGTLLLALESTGQLKMLETTDPAAVADCGYLYTKQAGTTYTELYYRNSNGDITQLTPFAGGAPSDAPYLTNGAVAGLSAEVDITTTGTTLSWQQPVVFTSASGTGAACYDLQLYHDKSGAASDVCGTLSFWAKNTTPAKTEYARLTGIVTTATAGAEFGDLFVTQMINGSMTEVARFDANGYSATVPAFCTYAISSGSYTTNLYAMANASGWLYLSQGRGVASADGTDSWPAFTFQTQQTLGIYRDSANVMGVTCGSAKTATFGVNLTTLFGTTAATGHELRFNNTASNANDDIAGILTFYAPNSTPVSTRYALISGNVKVRTAASQCGYLTFGGQAAAVGTNYWLEMFGVSVENAGYTGVVFRNQLPAVSASFSVPAYTFRTKESFALDNGVANFEDSDGTCVFGIDGGGRVRAGIFDNTAATPSYTFLSEVTLGILKGAAAEIAFTDATRIFFRSQCTRTQLFSDAAQSTGHYLEFYQHRASPAINDVPGSIWFSGQTSDTDAKFDVARIYAIATGVTAATRTGALDYYIGDTGGNLRRVGRFGINNGAGAEGGWTFDNYGSTSSCPFWFRTNLNFVAGQFLTTFTKYQGTTPYNTMYIDGQGVQTLAGNIGASSPPGLIFLFDRGAGVTYDYLGEIKFKGKDTASNVHTYVRFLGYALDATSGSEDGQLLIYTCYGGSEDSVYFCFDNTGFGTSGTGTAAAPVIHRYAQPNTGIYYSGNGVAIGANGVQTVDLGASASTVTIYSQDATAGNGAVLQLYHNKSGAASDINGIISFYGKNATPAQKEYGRITSTITDATSASEDGVLDIHTMRAGTVTQAARFTNTGEILAGGDGSLTNPSFAFVSDPNTGFYRPEADRMIIVVGGNTMIDINNNNHSAVGFLVGSVTYPSITCTSYNDTGIYFPADHTVGVALNSILYAQFYPEVTTLYSPSATAANGPKLEFRHTKTGASYDTCGEVYFYANTATTTTPHEMVKLLGYAYDSTAGTEQGAFYIYLTNQSVAQNAYFEFHPTHFAMSMGGSASVPAIVRYADPDCGFYFNGNGVSVSNSGVQTVDLAANAGTVEVYSASATASVGAVLQLTHTKTGADNDVSGVLNYVSYNSTPAYTVFSFIKGGPGDVTAASQFGYIDVGGQSYGSSGTASNRWVRMTGANGTATETGLVLENYRANTGGSLGIYPQFTLLYTDSDAIQGPNLALYRDSSSPAASDEIGVFQFDANNSTPTRKVFGQFLQIIVDPTAAGEKVGMWWRQLVAGTLTDHMHLSEGGALSVKMTSGSSHVGLVADDWDDAMVLRDMYPIERIWREDTIQQLADMGVIEPANLGEGYLVKVQPMFALLAGGVYQTREHVDKVVLELEMLRARVAYLESCLPAE